MKDKLGHPLMVGDLVAFTRKGEHVVQVGRVEIPDYPKHWAFPRDMYITVAKGCLKAPCDVVLVRHAEPEQQEIWPGSFLP